MLNIRLITRLTGKAAELEAYMALSNKKSALMQGAVMNQLRRMPDMNKG